MNEDLSWSGELSAPGTAGIAQRPCFCDISRFLGSMTRSCTNSILIKHTLPSITDAKELLRKWRDDNERKSGKRLIQMAAFPTDWRDFLFSR
jgi:hypothetical protein